MNDFTARTDHEAELSALASSTDRLLATVDSLDDEQIAAPSLLPGWTRGHVLAHLARNADALRNLVAAARTGTQHAMYASQQQRDAEIERDAARPAAAHREDLERSARAFAADLRDLPADRLDVLVQARGREFPAAAICWRRLREVEVHHVDLGAGYTAELWPATFVTRCLDDVAPMFAARSDVPAMTLRALSSGKEWRLGEPEQAARAPAITGPERALLAWLTGRGDGRELAVEPPGPLPQPPAWA